jgi:hypothetical protein
MCYNILVEKCGGGGGGWQVFGAENATEWKS